MARSFLALVSQENFLHWSKPFDFKFSRKDGFDKSLCSASFRFSTECGLIKIALSPTTSGSEEMFEVMTGQPHFIASSGGIPNPSYKDG